MSKFFSRVLKMNQVYGLPTPGRPQLYDNSLTATHDRLVRFREILQDELDEVNEIINTMDRPAPYVYATPELLARIADWLGDMQVYCASEMAKYGMDNDEVLDIIMDSNESKLGADGRPIVENGKIVKGPNFIDPHERLLGYVSGGKVVRDKEERTPSANDTQVAGTHYKVPGKPDHWDLVTMFQWDYFQAQITKYLMRWKKKHPTVEGKITDLRKAHHFLEKYIEVARDHLPADAKQETDATGSNAFWQNEGYYGDGTQLYTCRRCKSTTRQTHAPAQPHPPCAGAFTGAPDAS